MHNKIIGMAEMQDSLNREIDADWRSLNREWYRAIWIECGELMDHIGWKWWKHQNRNDSQLVLELIDILHFGLSDLLNNGWKTNDSGLTPQAIAKLIIECEQHFHYPTVHDPLISIELFASSTLLKKRFCLTTFIALLKSLNLTFADLYKPYVGKNILDSFRNKHGYKSGEYLKIWGGKEDNVHLASILEELDENSSHFCNDVETALGERYCRKFMKECGIPKQS